MQQIARCLLQEGVAAGIKPTFHQQVYLPEFIRAHAEGKFFAFRSSESSGPKRSYQARHRQEVLLSVFPFALLFMVCHLVPPQYVNVNLHLHNCQVQFLAGWYKYFPWPKRRLHPSRSAAANRCANYRKQRLKSWGSTGLKAQRFPASRSTPDSLRAPSTAAFMTRTRCLKPPFWECWSGKTKE